MQAPALKPIFRSQRLTHRSLLGAPWQRSGFVASPAPSWYKSPCLQPEARSINWFKSWLSCTDANAKFHYVAVEVAGVAPDPYWSQWSQNLTPRTAVRSPSWWLSSTTAHPELNAFWTLFPLIWVGTCACPLALAGLELHVQHEKTPATLWPVHVVESLFKRDILSHPPFTCPLLAAPPQQGEDLMPPGVKSWVLGQPWPWIWGKTHQF